MMIDKKRKADISSNDSYASECVCVRAGDNTTTSSLTTMMERKHTTIARVARNIMFVFTVHVHVTFYETKDGRK